MCFLDEHHIVMSESCLSTCQRQQILNDGMIMSPTLDVLAHGVTFFQQIPPSGRPKLKLRFLSSATAPAIFVTLRHAYLALAKIDLGSDGHNSVPKAWAFGVDDYVPLVGVLRLQNTGKRTLSDFVLRSRRITELVAHVILANERKRIVFRAYRRWRNWYSREDQSPSTEILADMDTMAPPVCSPSCLLNPIHDGKYFDLSCETDSGTQDREVLTIFSTIRGWFQGSFCHNISTITGRQRYPI